jgi:hypothetical protein
MDISAILAEFGAVYKAGGQGVKDLQTKLTQKSETDAVFGLRVTENTVLEKSTASHTRVLQSFQKGFTPLGSSKFELEKIPLYKLKVDVSEYPDEIEESWLGFLADSNLSRKDWGYVKYWLEQLVLPQMQEDWEKFEVFKGVRTAPTTGTASASGTLINGIRKMIQLANAASKTNKVVLGAPPTDPVLFVEYMETFYKSIPELHRSALIGFNMSKTLRDRFKEGMRTKYNTNYAQVGSLLTIIDSSIAVNGYESHAGSDMVWTTIKGNTAMGVKKPANETVFKVEESKREVVAMTDFYKGLGFWYYPYVYHNDRDLV